MREKKNKRKKTKKKKKKTLHYICNELSLIRYRNVIKRKV